MKKWIVCLVFSASVLSLPVFFKGMTNGFRVGKLAYDLPYEPSWDANSSLDEATLKQPFRYLSHGAQSFVFVSEDKRYILKLFRGDRWAHPWRLYLRHVMLGKKKRLPLYKKDHRLFCACKLAYERASDLTGLVYIHLNPTQSLPKGVVIDNLGRRYTLDLNRYRFAIQERGDSLPKRLAEANAKELELLTRSFRELLEERTRRGIANGDTKVHTNFGFIGNKAIEWDFGNYWLDDELRDETKRQIEIEQFASKFSKLAHR